MIRCVFAALMALSLLSPTSPAKAEPLYARSFPQEALRGEATFGTPPSVTINGQATRLAPGSKIRGQNNMMVMSGPLMGQTHIVHYTRDLMGQPKDVWLLRADEVERTPWPATPDESRTWQFNATTQTWAKP